MSGMNGDAAAAILAIIGGLMTVPGAIWSFCAWHDITDHSSFWYRHVRRDGNNDDAAVSRKKMMPPLTLLGIGLLFELPVLSRLWTAVFLG